MTNLSVGETHSNSVLRLNIGASGSGCAVSATCPRFVTFFNKASTSELSGVGIGSLKMNTAGTGVVLLSGAADFGEYLLLYSGSEYGEIVSQNQDGYVKGRKNSKITGVISDNTAFVGNGTLESDPNAKTVGYLGIVHTKVTTENGEIRKGDPIGVGSIPGVGVKMVNAGYIVGHATENFSGTGIGKIEVQIAPSLV